MYVKCTLNEGNYATRCRWMFIFLNILALLAVVLVQGNLFIVTKHSFGTCISDVLLEKYSSRGVNITTKG